MIASCNNIWYIIAETIRPNLLVIYDRKYLLKNKICFLKNMSPCVLMFRRPQNTPPTPLKIPKDKTTHMTPPLDDLTG